MTLATLKLKLFSTFYSLSLGMFLIPDWSMTRCVDLLECLYSLWEPSNELTEQMLLHQTWRLWISIRILVETTSGQAGEMQKALHDPGPLSHRKLLKTIPFGASRSKRCQKICSGTEKERFFHNISWESRFNTDHQGQRGTRTASLPGWRTSINDETFLLKTRWIRLKKTIEKHAYANCMLH